jgi:hypothetical protein
VYVCWLALVFLKPDCKAAEIFKKVKNPAKLAF